MLEGLIGAFTGEETLTTVAASTGSSMGTYLMVGLWVLILAGGAWFLMYWTSFKHTVLIREITSTRKFIVTDKARIKRDKEDGVEYWQLRKRKAKLISPHSESIEITKKGRFYAECYHDLESGKDAGYSWIQDKGEGEFISYPAEHRALLNARIRRAAERRGKTTFEMVMTIAAVGVPLIALVLVFSFWGDLTEQTTTASEKLTVAMNDFSEKVSSYACSQEIIANTPPVYSSQVPLDQQIGVTS